MSDKPKTLSDEEFAHIYNKILMPNYQTLVPLDIKLAVKLVYEYTWSTTRAAVEATRQEMQAQYRELEDKYFSNNIGYLDLIELVRHYSESTYNKIFNGKDSHLKLMIERQVTQDTYDALDYEFCKSKVLEMQSEIDKRDALLEIAKKALHELGHHGIDFGYGKYDCDVARIAQTALKELNGVKDE